MALQMTVMMINDRSGKTEMMMGEAPGHVDFGE
jgi:hypothetical protein